jgi:hypothetical protein
VTILNSVVNEQSKDEHIKKEVSTDSCSQTMFKQVNAEIKAHVQITKNYSKY